MPRRKPQGPSRDIYLAGIITGIALQLNTELLTKHLAETPDNASQYKDELRATVAYAIRMQRGPAVILP
jgi:hypothetical protein